MIQVLNTSKSDILGAFASGLCVIHCVATPFLFIAQSCSAASSCCSASPTWWSAIDYLFIGITFFAVFQSGKNTNRMWLKYALYANWVLLSLFVINEKIAVFALPTFLKYITAFGLIGLHLYNLKFCRCNEEVCCAT